MAEVETGREGGVLTITLNRPEVLNALTSAAQKQLLGALKEARADDVRAVVLTGAGRGFCVGQDLTEFREGADDISERRALKRSRPGKRAYGNAAEVISSSPTRRGIDIYSREGAPVVAVNDGVITEIGKSKELGRFIVPVVELPEILRLREALQRPAARVELPPEWAAERQAVRLYKAMHAQRTALWDHYLREGASAGFYGRKEIPGLERAKEFSAKFSAYERFLLKQGFVLPKWDFREKRWID